MAVPELEASAEGLRTHIVAMGAGMDAEALRDLWKYKRVSSVYLILGGKQRLTLPQIRELANAAAGKGEWRDVDVFHLVQYLQGFASVVVTSMGAGLAKGGKPRSNLRLVS